MKKQTQGFGVSKRMKQGTIMTQIKSVQLVAVFGIGLTVMGCGEGGNGMMTRLSHNRIRVRTSLHRPCSRRPGQTSPRFRTRSNRTGPLWGRQTTAIRPGRSPRTAVTARSTGTAAGNNDTTTAPVTPFNMFLNTRGAQFTTPGTGLSQAPPRAGLRAAWLRSSTIRPTAPSSAPSALRGCSPRWAATSPRRCSSYPAPMELCRQRSRGFGAVFTDVDLPDGSGPGDKNGNRQASTRIECFGTDGGLLFSSFVPASPGDGSLSFFGIVFADARIARVRITSGDAAPGPNDDGTA